MKMHRINATECSRLGAAALLLSCAVAAAQAPGPVLRVNTYATGDQQAPAIASDGAGNYLVVWQSDGEDGSLAGIYAQRYAANGTRLGGEFRVNSYTTNMQILPAVAMNAAGAFVIVWDSVGQNGNGLGVYGQRYAANGAPLGGEFKLNTSTNDMSTQIGIAIDASGNFAVAWPEHFTPLGVSTAKTSLIDLRLYGADGSARGNPITIATSLTDNLRVPAVAMNSSNIVVTWNAAGRGHLLAGPAGLGVGIRAQRLKADGTQQGLTIDVNAVSASVVVDRPVVALDAGSNFVIAWETLGTDLSPHGVHARRYAANGSAIAAEFAVGDVSKLQRNPAIAMGAAGNFAIAAHSDGIYLQTYGANAAPMMSTRVDDSSLGNSGALSPALAFDAAGNIVLAWQDYGRDGDGRGIAVRAYR
ncbi:MAG: hypothetical protein JWR16_2071 [Nevskia sp.]|nr:hypothetical protein [Nevskia sp.]